MNYYINGVRRRYTQELFRRLLHAVLIFLALFVVIDLTIGPRLTEVVKSQTMVVTGIDRQTKTLHLQSLETVGNVINTINSSVDQIEFILTDKYAEMIDSVTIGDRIEVKAKEKTSTLLGMKTSEETGLLSMSEK